jgi:hypothetical protein
LKLLLARADHKDPKALADEADNLWGMHMMLSEQLVAVSIAEVPEGELVVVRVATEAGRGQEGRGRRGRRGQRHPNESQPSKEARAAAGLCIKHWRFGEQAQSCTLPCSWPGVPKHSCPWRAVTRHRFSNWHQISDGHRSRVFVRAA